MKNKCICTHGRPENGLMDLYQAIHFNVINAYAQLMLHALRINHEIDMPLLHI